MDELDSYLEEPIDNFSQEEIPEEGEVMQEEILVEEQTPQAPPFSEEEIQKALGQLYRDAKDEDRFVRDNYLLLWERLEYYWNNILDIFQDPTTGTWVVPDWNRLEEEGETPPRLINIYRPYGEVIVAALSVAIPGVVYFPDDPDNPNDVETARGYGAITELNQLHNKAAMQIIKALTIIFNNGTIFGYNYYHKDPKYGTLKTPRIEFKDLVQFEIHCPQCGEAIDGGTGTPEPIGNCMTCGYQGPVEPQISSDKFPQIVGWDETPKGIICQELFSGRNVKVSAYARNQEECGYLLLEFLQSVPMLRSVFQDKADRIQAGSSGSWETYTKIPLQYFGEMPQNAANVACLWLRPWQFFQLGNVDLAKHLMSLYPEGAYAIFVNNELMDIYPENMDDHWTISPNPMGTNLYMRALGENLATIQDIRAELVEIELQTAEYGIPETFADPRVLDFTKYGGSRAKPGMVTQAKPVPGKTIADGFHTVKSAILSQEIDPLRQHIDNDAQFVSGAYPSVYGGPAQGGSKTAAEYQQSKAQALQRLGTIWKIISTFWADFQSRSAVEKANVLKELGMDENFAKREGGGFVNVWIRQASLTGKIGRCEPESADQLPITWAARKDAMMQLMSLNNDAVLQVLAHPRNSGILKDAYGISDLYIPGEDSRLRQLEEFKDLSQGIPIPINEMVDNNAIHAETLKSLLEGPEGRMLSQEGMMASIQHLAAHEEVLAAQQARQIAEQQAAAPESKPTNKDKVNG